MAQFTKRSLLPSAPSEVYRWHMRPGAFERLAPPWQDVRVVARSGQPDEEGGFAFRHDDVGEALRHVLGRS